MSNEISEIPPPEPPAEPPAQPPAEKSGQTSFNLALAGSLTALSLWLATVDLLSSGDPLFQTSPSLPLLSFFLITLSLAALVLAVIPKRIVVAAASLLLLRLALGFPFNLWLPNPVATAIVSLGLVAIGAWYCLACSRSALRIGSRPWFRFTHSFALGGSGFLLLLLALPIILLGYVCASRNLLGDYIRFSTKSISLVERVLEKDGQKVHLIGMMHIGDGSYYADLQARMNAPLQAENQRRLILTEGVADHSQLLPKTFTTGKTYGKFAERLGISAQPKFGDQPEVELENPEPVKGQADFVNADIDISELEPAHRKTLVTLLEWLGKADPAHMLLQAPEGITGQDVENLLMKGLLSRRNDTLMTRFTQKAPAYQEIYIPWGAAHLADIEKRLRLLGYSSVSETIRPIVTFAH